VRLGFGDTVAGHITVLQPDGSLIVNPFGFLWSEFEPSDVMRIDLDGNVLEGKWSVTAAIELHLALHRARPGTTVAVHNHPAWSTIWASAHRVPPAYDQTGAQLEDIVLYDEYAGTVTERDNAERAIEGLGPATVALLANHGVLVLGEDVPTAYRRCRALEHRARSALFVEGLGGAAPLPDDVCKQILGSIAAVGRPVLWESAVRRELREDPGLAPAQLGVGVR
jgi:ribulose-5-phosphate 4-epimerase/fuculose-1-phosphate aldolase